MNYQRSYCGLCKAWMVICPTCGNNSCNGGYGELKDGSECPDCEESYRLMLNDLLLMNLPVLKNEVMLDVESLNVLEAIFGKGLKTSAH